MIRAVRALGARWHPWMLGFLLVGVVACASSSEQAPSPAPSQDLTGVWRGAWSSMGTQQPVILNLQQTGSRVTGTLLLAGTFGGPSSGVIDGIVTGNIVRLTGSWRGDLIVMGDQMHGVLTGASLVQIQLIRQR